jgi:hypothetical protein
MHAGPVGAPESATTGLLAFKGVQITRRVADTNGAERRIEHLPSPPKVLVVVASALTDTRIRAGAEYLGLMRALKLENKVLNTRLVIGATAADMSLAIRTFRPNVIHVIGHGETRLGKPVILFRPEQAGASDHAVDAKSLLELMRTEEGLALPGLVVLNACADTAIDEVTVGRPMAAELVGAGIPVVVGMSGNVADQACRLFTRGFYTALLNGTEIAKAAAIGRRAGVLYAGYDVGRQIDWALPTLYMAEAVGAPSIDLTVPDTDLARLMAAAMFTETPNYPPFCGRWEHLARFRSLLSGTTRQFMLLRVARADSVAGMKNVPPKFGSERLLKEFAAEAFRDGHVPILISKDWLDVEAEWPRSRQDFANRCLFRALKRTRDVLEEMPEHALEIERLWPLTGRIFGWKSAADSFPNGFEDPDVDEAQQLAMALTLDLLELRRLVVEQRGQPANADVKVVVLLEDFHDLEFGPELLQLFGSRGLASKQARPWTRAVISYQTKNVGTDQQAAIKAIEAWQLSGTVDPCDLGTLHPVFGETMSETDAGAAQEAALVYRQFLLGWSDGTRKRPLSVPRSELDRLYMYRLAQQTGFGVPSMLDTDGAIGAISFMDGTVARSANDDDALEADRVRAAGGGTGP